MDYSNLCIKWVEDALVTANLIPDDGPNFVKKIELVQVKSNTPKVVIEIYEIN